jgi:hypothetical protein
MLAQQACRHTRPASPLSPFSILTSVEHRRRRPSCTATPRRAVAHLHAMVGSRATVPLPLPPPLLSSRVLSSQVMAALKLHHYRHRLHSRWPPSPPPSGLYKKGEPPPSSTSPIPALLSLSLGLEHLPH